MSPLADAGRSQTWSLPCGCTYQPGIDLPIKECDVHRDDPDLPHPEGRSRSLHQWLGNTWRCLTCDVQIRNVTDDPSALGVMEQCERVAARRAARQCVRPVAFVDYCWPCSTWHDPEPEPTSASGSDGTSQAAPDA